MGLTNSQKLSSASDFILQVQESMLSNDQKICKVYQLLDNLKKLKSSVTEDSYAYVWYGWFINYLSEALEDPDENGKST